MLLDFDLAGAEWYVTAYLTAGLVNGTKMLAVAKSGKSPHTLTGATLSGLPPELVELENSIIGKSSDPLIIAQLRREKLPPEIFKAQFLPRGSSIRQASKTANFGLNYREGPDTYSRKNEIDFQEAKKVVQLYRERSYPELVKWYQWIDAKIRKDRILTNCLGRKIWFMGALNDDTFRQATAAVPQSTVFDIAAQAMPKMLNDDSADFAAAQLLAQVHDSLLTQYLNRDFKAMARYAIKLGLDYMSPWLDYGEPFKLNVTMKTGLDWGNLNETKLSMDESAVALALEESFEKSMKKRQLRKAA